MDGWMDGWVGGWVDGLIEKSKSQCKNCLQQYKIGFSYPKSFHIFSRFKFNLKCKKVEKLENGVEFVDKK